MTDPILLSATGVIILGLFSVLWYFIQRFIKKTEENDAELVATLDQLNTTMNEINTNLLVFRTNTVDQFVSINKTIEEVNNRSKENSKQIDSLKTTVNTIVTHHSRNHPNDKIKT